MSAYDGYFIRGADRSEASARKIVPCVLELVHPRSVVDVGCGVGAWLKIFGEFGIRDLIGVDAPYVPHEALRFDASRFVAADLTQPLKLGRRFDLAVSLEVGEHLRAEYARTLVASLTDLAPVVLFSAAPPGQGGIDHVNEQWPTYWAALFATHGYSPIDAIRDRVWDDPDVDWWYRQNTLLFASAHAKEAIGSWSPDPLRRTVHPDWIAGLEAKIREPSLRALAVAFPGALKRSAQYRLRKRTSR
jgi:SAM-dependent methyltransferase